MQHSNCQNESHHNCHQLTQPRRKLVHNLLLKKKKKVFTKESTRTGKSWLEMLWMATWPVDWHASAIELEGSSDFYPAYFLAGLPSHAGDVTDYVWHKTTTLAHSFLFCSCVCFCLDDPFNCISFHQFSRQLSIFWLCSSGLIAASLVLSTSYLCMKVFFSPDIIPRAVAADWAQSTN